ncbi:hypothetical protein MF406_02360 [Georgenia sp. TF02-10]|uniref:hypothetical protein n=1 Tax=Georgenia sp. TF02-10 TaxID=2917725 RepID=UPI001FA6C9A5|nr:hypothetical protein [Georgenia sp. TF02-10]UNX55150.1 hypothetical protein MF406_02360 [Georgenia sp. TF02-10]
MSDEWAEGPPEVTYFTFEPLDEHFEWTGDFVAIDANGLDVPQGWLWTTLDDILRPNGGEPRYSIVYSRRTTEWGASGDVAEVAVQLSGDIFIAIAADSLLRYARRLATHVRDASARRTFTEDEAIESARLRVATRYETSADDLMLASVTQAGETFTVELREPGGIPRYEVSVSLVHGLVMFALCKRILAE